MLNKLGGLARSLYILLAVIAGFVTIGAVNVALLLGYAALMMSVCLLACIVPTRRALSVQPTEALRAE